MDGRVNEREYHNIAVVLENCEAYVANAESEDQHERYLEMREMLAGDPEWHDGEIIYNDA